MGIQESSEESRRAAFQEACRILQNEGVAGGRHASALKRATERRRTERRRYLVVSAHSETPFYQKALAEAGLFLGVKVTTLAGLVQDIWELWGDGRVPVNSIRRSLLVRKILKEYLRVRPESKLVATAGVLALLENVFAEALPALCGCDESDESGQEVTELALRYAQELEKLSCLEYSQSLDLLAGTEALEASGIVVLDTPTTVLEDRLLATADSCSIIRVEGFDEQAQGRAEELRELQAMLFRASGEAPVEVRGALSFAFPAGSYARLSLITEELARLVEVPGIFRVAVASSKPSSLFRGIARRGEKGRSLGRWKTLGSAQPSGDVETLGSAQLELCSSLAFEETDFGRAWCALLDFIASGDASDTFSASDFALSPFSGMSVESAYSCDARWRSWRGQTVDEAITDMVGYAWDGQDRFVPLVSEGEIAEALQLYREFIYGHPTWSEAYVVRQLQAVALAERVHEEIDSLGASCEDYLAVLRKARVGDSMQSSAFRDEVSGDGVPGDKDAFLASRPVTVRILSYDELAQHFPASFDATILCDLDASSWLVRQEKNATEVLLDTFGLYKNRDELAEMRLLFARCLATAKKQVVVSRTLTTPEGDPNLPALVLEELIDCYRSDLGDPDELHEDYGLPASLLVQLHTKGDEHIGANVSADGHASELSLEIPIYPTGFTKTARGASGIMWSTGSLNAPIVPDASNAPDVLGISDASDAPIVPDISSIVPVLSPSALESYLECPYRWFIGNRIDSGVLDAGLGFAEFGSFAHSVLKEFYARFGKAGVPRVTEGNLDSARALLSSVFDELLEVQPELPPNRALLIVANELEAAEVAGLKRDLLAFLGRETGFLPDYHPAYHELVIGEEQSCEYAGIRLRGRIDRIDIDGLGNAVIVDYKGSIDKSYAYGGEEAAGAAGADGADDDAVLLRFPRKIQVLVYAQMLRRSRGLMPQAALYRSYKKPPIFGSYDRRFLSSARDLPGIAEKDCAVGNLCETLDRVEEMIAKRLESFKAGDIRACPVDGQACTYCPLSEAWCSGRDVAPRRG